MTKNASLGKLDREHLDSVIELAIAAAERGQAPFAARLVVDGRVIADASNSVRRDGDVSAHAEINLLRKVAGIDADQLARATLYSSTEPCAMCASAICWSSISRVVYGLSHVEMRQLAPTGKREPGLLGNEVFDRTAGAPEFVGPCPDVDPARPFERAHVDSARVRTRRGTS